MNYFSFIDVLLHRHLFLSYKDCFPCGIVLTRLPSFAKHRSPYFISDNQDILKSLFNFTFQHIVKKPWCSNARKSCFIADRDIFSILPCFILFIVEVHHKSIKWNNGKASSPIPKPLNKRPKWHPYRQLIHLEPYCSLYETSSTDQYL